MTRNARRSTRDERPVGPTLTVGLLALGLLAAAAVAGTAAAQPDGPTVQVSDVTVAPDGTADVDVVLTNATDGLAGYYLELSVEDGDVARIQSADYPAAFALTSDPVVGPENRTVRLEAADVEGRIERGVSNVTLATVQLVGVEPGAVDVTVEPLQFDSDDGEPMEPTTAPGRLVVPGDGSGGAAPPSDDADAGTDTDETATKAGNATASETPSSAMLGLLAVGLAVAAACALVIVRLRNRGDA